MPVKHCECPQPGYCQRFQREMQGRMHEICRGYNVDAGEAAELRSQWDREVCHEIASCPHRGAAIEGKKEACAPCGGKQRQVFECSHPTLAPHETTLQKCSECLYRPREGGRKLVLHNHLSPGDVLVMSAAIYGLHRANPGKFQTAVSTSADALFENNPDVVACDGEAIQMHYPAVHKCNERGIHFMQGYCEFLSDVLGVPVPLLTNRPKVYLSNSETRWMSQMQELGYSQPFWLINAGRKDDYTAKHWGAKNFQTVVDQLRGKILFVQVGALEHHHPSLEGVVDLRGKTDMRQLVRLCYHASGVLCGVTMLQHLAAALEKPSVVVMGGREPVQWNSYPKQQLLHTIGQLSCCQGGCWKSRVARLNDGSAQDSSLCEQPMPEGIGRCMALISPEEVAALVQRLAFHK